MARNYQRTLDSLEECLEIMQTNNFSSPEYQDAEKLFNDKIEFVLINERAAFEERYFAIGA